jgi:hypothetical protein
MKTIREMADSHAKSGAWRPGVSKSLDLFLRHWRGPAFPHRMCSDEFCPVCKQLAKFGKKSS